jgi:dTDP-4-dehydrorhamnose 3,5-epimerase
VLRGLHYQIKRPQGKLVRVVEGEILDVAVDVRRSSPTFGGWEAMLLSGDNQRMLWIPEGFAHGFRVISAQAHVFYKATDYYAPEYERTLAWNDPDLKINWELDGDPIVSAKDQRGVALRDAETFE